MSESTLDGGTFLDDPDEAMADGGSFEVEGATALDKMRELVASYPGADVLSGLSIDYADRVPECASLFPSGLVEVRRRTDIPGVVTVENRYNFALYTVLTKAPADDDGATYNAEWVADFQEWVQEQSARRMAPTFGDEPRSERITAQNGQIYSAQDEGVAVYAIQLSVSFVRHFGRSW